MGVIIPQIVTEDKAGGAQVIDGSLRFDNSKSQYLNRTLTTAGNRRTWTISFWFKKGKQGNWGGFFHAGDTDSQPADLIYQYSDDTWYIQSRTSGGSDEAIYQPTQVFRDTGWYHVVIAVDTTQATESERQKIYINGQRITNFASTNGYSQDYQTEINSTTYDHRIGRTFQIGTGTNYYIDGQFTQYYLIDGQALDPSYFGYTDPLTNTWRPKKLKSGAATINDGRTWSSNYGNLRTGGTQTNPFDADNTNYAQVSVGGGGYFTFPDGLNGRLEVLASTGSPNNGDSTQTVTISNNSGAVASRTTSKGYNTGPEAIDFGVVSGITSVFLTDQGLFWGFRINSITLRDGVTETIGFGTNGFYLPMDGNTPIGQDQSGRGNNWTPVNFGGSNTIEKATGALPILNTDGGGKVARVGVRTDSTVAAGVGTCVLALPLVGIKSDFSNQVDSRSSNKAVTENGGISDSSIQSNFYGRSYLFDGSNDYLTVGTNTDWTFLHNGSSYTVECWVYATSTYGYLGRGYIFFNTQGAISVGETGFAFWCNSSSIKVFAPNGNPGSTQVNLSYNYVLPANKWTHLAVTFDGSTCNLFIDGVISATDTASSFSASTSTNTLNIGRTTDSYYFNDGYLQDVRIYQGVKYTQNFIPASTDPDILPDTPSGVAYSSNVALVPSTDGAVAFDGSGDYLSLASSIDFRQTGDFTMECWIYPTSVSGVNVIIDGRGGSSSKLGPVLYLNGTNLVLDNGAGAVVTASSVMFTNTWFHIAGTRSGNTWTLYLNGISQGSATDTSTYSSDTGVWIGNSWNSEFFDGFISNAHIVKGTALYTSNFTPPTAPIASVANTKLLCCKSNSSATAFDVSPGTITANGNAAASNFNPFTVNINTQRGQESGYATLNPLDNDGNTLSNGNLNLAGSGNTFRYTRSSTYVNEGKWYWECTIAATGGQTRTGPQILRATDTLGSHTTGNLRGYIYIYDLSGTIYIASNPNGSNSNLYTTSGSLPAGTIVGLALDSTNGRLWVSVDGVWLNGGNPGAGTNAPVTGLTGPYTPGGWAYNTSDLLLFTFGQKPFKFPPPAGFQPLALANTPRPTIVRPDQYVGIVTYYAADGVAGIATGLSFKPDLVWVKSRTSARSNVIVDSVRGTSSVLWTNLTDAQLSSSQYVSQFNSNGFNYGVAGDVTNNSSLVGWCWKAGGNSNTYNINDVGYATASAAGLTAGTITPTGASVNTKSGFSIIAYTGTGSAGSVPHGLGKEPYMIILKTRGVVDDWRVYHKFLDSVEPEDYYLMLQSTNARSADQGASFMNDTAPTSTTFSLGTDSAINGNTRTMIAYCWAEIPGFSKFGSYTGNNSTDGPVVITGFKPAFVLIRQARTDATGRDWMIFDNKRSVQYGAGGFNAISTYLYPNYNVAEASAASIDFLSNGFKIRASDSTNNNINGSGQNHIYAAFAETPSFNLYGGQSNAR